MQSSTVASTTITIQNDHLKQMLEFSEKALADSKSLFANLSQNQLVWKPAPKSWNILECFRHLYIAADLYYPRIQDAVRTARENNMVSEKAFSPAWFAKKFIGLIVPESKLRIRTTRLFTPESNFMDVAIQQQFLEIVEKYIELIKQADGFELNKKMLQSPATKLLKFSIGEAIWLITVHNLRHIQQAQNITQLPDFPGD